MSSCTLAGGFSCAVQGEKFLPERGFLSLDQYLAIQRSIGNETRFRLLDLLVEDGRRRAIELRNALSVESDALHEHLDHLDHLDHLVEVGSAENRKRKGPDRDGLYSYYRATPSEREPSNAAFAS